mmetsp:Transcript_3710/g.13713  ORF Transcript_3710/g.13713 Transcript_3710/m.13713 type:complete len:145 (+) Transcript_3710:347-781(+)
MLLVFSLPLGWRSARCARACIVMFARTDDGSFDVELGTWAGGPLKQWLLAEIAENRLKQYQHGEKEYWSAPADVSAHDPRALPSFAASPEFALALTHRLVAGPAAGAAAGAGQAVAHKAVRGPAGPRRRCLDGRPPTTAPPAAQ